MLDDVLRPVNDDPEPVAGTGSTHCDLTFKGFAAKNWEAYLVRRDVKATTRSSYAAMLKRHIFPSIGDMNLREITASDVAETLSDLLSKLSRKTVMNAYQLLRVMFEVAVDDDLITGSPVRRKHRPKPDRKKLPIWTPQQVQQILSAVPSRWQAFFWCLAVFSVRIGELLAIQVADVDLEKQTVQVNKHIWNGRLQQSTKTDEEFVKHIPETLVPIVKKHLEVLGGAPTDFLFRRSPEDLRSCDPNEIRDQVLYPVLDRCEIRRCVPRASGFHAFRRAAGKYLRKEAGLELAAVQLGHKRMTTTDEHCKRPGFGRHDQGD